MFDIEDFVVPVYIHGLVLPITLYVFFRYDLYEITGFGRDNVETVFDLIQIMMATGALFFCCSYRCRFSYVGTYYFSCFFVSNI